MTVNEIVLLVIIGILAGFVGGTFGVGGGIVIIPALIFILNMTQHQAQGTSLAVLLMPIGFLAVYNYHKQGFVNYKYAAILVFTFIIGSYLGSLVAVNISGKLLRKLFGVLMLIASLKLILSK